MRDSRNEMGRASLVAKIKKENNFKEFVANKEDYIKPLLQLADNTQLIQQMSEEAIKFATHNFAKQNEVNAIKNLYEEQLIKH